MDLKHPNDYKMYNFCCEPGRGYNADFFHGRVERYPFKDHNTPPLETIIAFANSAKKWLDENPAHVVNMHCKAGKGRAGLMSCILLIRTGEVQSADEALDLYDKLRVSDKKGLTVTRYTLAHSFIHSFTHSLTRLLTRSLTNLLTNLLIIEVKENMSGFMNICGESIGKSTTT